MKKVFTAIDHYFDSESQEYNRLDAYNMLLNRFASACRHKGDLEGWNPKKRVKLSFSYWLIKDCPDAELVKQVVKETYENCDGDLYMCGDKYNTIEDLIEEIKDYKAIGQLIVEG